ncbi:tRNA-U20-dihydrouridine synthase [Lentimicrobium saccharophilum]|uniref:tRNA-dihydrouridine synthase n=1 Tax=Lentimicrobium saccharophilum TaxID=1678841 RepID=A0A0S7BTU3_9BACT|nr:tRNA dihydrouridine synthase DusB [Lentimicrobium saccharophilum]GAP41963.1 tRNA-U20-dihydrouridine synthase [Lentimicrobium saccharophilum]
MKIGSLEIIGLPLFLAPMEDVTDPPFRKICRELGADVVVTEFISSEGLIRDVAGSLKKLEFSADERPVGIQIFGNNVEAMINAARVAASAAPDFIDLNFGCPVRKIVNKGGGAALLQDLPLLLQITGAVVKSVEVPVTVKTRLGWDERSKPIVDLALKLQDAGIAALTIHGRTRAQLYGGKADWTLIGEVKNHPSIHIPIIGNGDVTDGPSAKAMLDQTGVDGIMIGRASVGNPWIFREVHHYLATGNTLPSPGMDERLRVCRQHLETSVAWKGEITALLEMRRHYSHYFSGLPNFKPFRMRLMTTVSLGEVNGILDDIARQYCP